MGHLNVIQSWQLSKYLRKAYLAKYVKSVKVTSGPFHSWGGVTIEVLPRVLPPVARRWANDGIPRLRPATHIQRRPDGGPTVEYRLRPATHIQRSGAIWGLFFYLTRTYKTPLLSSSTCFQYFVCNVENSIKREIKWQKIVSL